MTWSQMILEDLGILIADKTKTYGGAQDAHTRKESILYGKADYDAEF